MSLCCNYCNYAKQMARHRKSFGQARGVVNPVKIYSHLLGHHAKFGCCYCLRVCRWSQKFGGRWAPRSINGGRHLSHPSPCVTKPNVVALWAWVGAQILFLFQYEHPSVSWHCTAGWAISSLLDCTYGLGCNRRTRNPEWWWWWWWCKNLGVTLLAVTIWLELGRL